MKRLQKTNETAVSYWILSLQAKDIYETQNQVNPACNGYNVRNEKGELSFKKFNMKFDNSLDLMEMQKIYMEHYARRGFGKEYNGRYYTLNVINVAFDFAYKKFNHASKDIYVKENYFLKDIKDSFDEETCLAVIDGEVVGVEVNKKAKQSDINLPAYFKYENGKIKVNDGKEIENIKSVQQLREYLYENGFTCDGKKYVRYKRSSGSSREGHCLFILDKLNDEMQKWSACGIDIKNDQKISLSEWEAYTSLTLSSIEKVVKLKPENILVLKDEKSVFTNEVIKVSQDNDNKLKSERAEFEIKNTIWDGEGLLDTSVFKEYGYEQKGMMLLRNRFFKTCAFNTNLQQWFADNEITDVSKLRGYTLAKEITDIKLVVTESSIKYTKFSNVEEWLKNTTEDFGVVKTEKPTHFFNGQMVQTNYQILNTLRLTREEVNQLLDDTARYIKDVRNDHEVLKYHINYNRNIMFDDGEMDYQDDIVFKLMDINDTFCRTQLYKDFRANTIKSLREKLKMGKILVRGTNATLFGNGYEFLRSTIYDFDGKSYSLNKGEVMSSAFDNDREILCARSPHITMGNLYLAKNVYNDNIAKYFNLSREIICVNAIDENLQHRLNGCDYDSDSMLITDNKLLVNSAKKHYNDFLVPTSDVKTIKKEKNYTNKNLAELDNDIQNNKVGEIVNLSQHLNSIYWDGLCQGKDQQQLYCAICKLAVLSGLEIDKAKRETTVNTAKELSDIKELEVPLYNTKPNKPLFFSMIDNSDKKRSKTETRSKAKEYSSFDTTMDYITEFEKGMKVFSSRDISLPFMTIFHAPMDKSSRSGNDTHARDKVLDIVKRADDEINVLRTRMKASSKGEKSRIYRQIKDRQEDCVKEIKDGLKSEWAMYYTLKQMDDDRCYYRWMLLFALFNERNKTLKKLIESSMEQRYKLVKATPETAEIFLYGYPFKKVKTRFKKKEDFDNTYNDNEQEDDFTNIYDDDDPLFYM